MGMLSRHEHTRHTHHHSPSAAKAEGLKYPVCGIAVTEQSEHHVELEGRPYKKAGHAGGHAAARLVQPDTNIVFAFAPDCIEARRLSRRDTPGKDSP